uniref:Uncharacterized protein n=1 Tax=Monomorphina parapyrum TaxID=1664066 RepID=A0A0G3VJQ1_9EUGL|nr:hypothetical protein [Monomorphina parapyrum]AKL78915.1 hypothetical protein [Monomorphina parapyrum]
MLFIIDYKKGELKKDIKKELYIIKDVLEEFDLSEFNSYFYNATKKNPFFIFGERIPYALKGGTRTHLLFTRIEGLLLDAIIMDLISMSMSGGNFVILNLEYDGITFSIPNENIPQFLNSFFIRFNAACMRTLGGIIPLSCEIYRSE